jgi:hypothetical protein
MPRPMETGPGRTSGHPPVGRKWRQSLRYVVNRAAWASRAGVPDDLRGLEDGHCIHHVHYPHEGSTKLTCAAGPGYD